MAEWYMPYAQPQPAQEAVSTPRPIAVKREFDPRNFLICSQCKKPIDQNEECMEFMPGVSGFGAKSGRPAVVDCEDPRFERAVLHIECIYDYVFEVEESLSYREGFLEEIEVCGLCGEVLQGVSPNFCSNCGAQVGGPHD